MKIKIKKSAIQEMINEAIKSQSMLNEAFKSKILTQLVQTLDTSGGWNSSDKKWLFSLFGSWGDNVRLSEVPDSVIKKIDASTFKPSADLLAFWFTNIKSTKPTDDAFGYKSNVHLEHVMTPFFKKYQKAISSWGFSGVQPNKGIGKLSISVESYSDAGKKLMKKYSNPKDFVTKIIQPALKQNGISLKKIARVPDVKNDGFWDWGSIDLDIGFSRVTKEVSQEKLLGITDGTKTLKGNSEYNKNFYKSIKDLKTNSTFVYSIDKNAAKKAAGGRQEIQQDRRLSKQNALALKSDYEVYRENHARFKKILSANRVEKNQYDKDFVPAMERITNILSEWIRNKEKYIGEDGYLKKPKFTKLSKSNYHRGYNGKSYTSTDNNILIVQNMLINAYQEYVKHKDDSSGSDYGSKLAKLTKIALTDEVEYKWY